MKEKAEIKEAVKHLKDALKLITKPNGWCQGALARDEQGNAIDCYGSKAVSFCLGGAIARSAGLHNYNSDAHNAANNWIWRHCNTFGIVGYNDKPGQTAKRIALVLERTITELQAKLRKGSPARQRPAPGRSKRSQASG